ncbi:hypothetical protein IFM89_008855 [Coptis chinensis]|uniref:Uncharacterized protein n=1 Tax=Coptis chinensis TaxID=261450 RepID=A0A835HD87_9MAGN|nr:hypothetical protein IFM89_008855 [Coptis chinensis]
MKLLFSSLLLACFIPKSPRSSDSPKKKKFNCTGYVDNERRLNVLSKTYNDRMDLGTRFALYYKQWLKIGVFKAPPVPSVYLPSLSSKRIEQVHQRSSSQSYKNPKVELQPKTKTSNFLRKLSYQSKPSIALVCNSHVDKNDVIVREPINHHNLPSSNLSSAIATICSSDIHTNCEFSIRVVAKAWLDSNGILLLFRLFKDWALEDLDSLFLQASRNDQYASVELMKAKIFTALGALDRQFPLACLIKERQLQMLIESKKIVREPEKLDPEIQKLESLL